MIWQALFWAALALLVYVHFAYPGALALVSSLIRAAPTTETNDSPPSLSLIIAAYNEERVIAGKLENTLALHYPADKLQIILVSDGSTDRTVEVASSYASKGVEVIQLPTNIGKARAQNQAVGIARGEILVFTDAEALLDSDAARRLVQQLQTDEVGCVVGRVQYTNQDRTCVSEGESAYWRYELSLRQTESSLGMLAMASGSIMAVRRALFQPLDPAVSEDFVLPMALAMRGHKTVYEPTAVARIPLFQVQPRAMLQTRARTITLDTRGLFLCRAILNPFRYPLYSWGLISHKLLRWLVPYFLIALFAVNLLLIDQPFYRFTLAAQIVCYALAGLGHFWQRTGRKPPRFLGIPFSFCLVNAAAAVGVARFLMGKKSGRWEPVREPIQ